MGVMTACVKETFLPYGGCAFLRKTKLFSSAVGGEFMCKKRYVFVESVAVNTCADPKGLL